MVEQLDITAVRQTEVRVFTSRDKMGFAAAFHAAERIRAYGAENTTVNMIFAAAPSQDEFYEALVSMSDVPWHKVEAFQLDEYAGLSESAPERFGQYLNEHLFGRIPIRRVHFIQKQGEQNPELWCTQYAAQLQDVALHLACIGIGENGHLAFNDPGVADFGDKEFVRIVELDEECRTQQVNDGCFRTRKEVPTHAITVTVPLIMSAREIICVVPGIRKALAVEKTLEGPITAECPASVLRRHQCTKIFLDNQSATNILKGA